MKPSAEIPSFIAIRDAAATSADGILSLSLSLVAAVPPGGPTVGILGYRFLLDTNDDGAWDHIVALELKAGGGFVPVLLDRSGTRLEGPAYPGTANLAGSRISMSVSVEALGCPAMVGFRAVAEQTRNASTVVDEAPGPNDWSRVETSC